MRSLPCLVINCNATAKAEIAYLDLAPIESNEDVRRLQISVDYMPSVHVHQPKKHLRSEAPHLLVCQYYALRVQQSVQVAIHELEREVQVTWCRL
jgi:hypothetical protein